MCGRFDRSIDNEALIEALEAELPDFDPGELHLLPLGYNLVPSLPILTVARSQPARPHRLALMRWGFIPGFARDTKLQPHNARAETLATSGMFRAAAERQRCLVIASCFYEWQSPQPEPDNTEESDAGISRSPNRSRDRGRHKQPFRVAVAGRPFFCMAGVWDVARIGGERVISCAIVTTEANAALRAIHPRMPLILDPADYAAWCDPARPAAAIAPLLHPFAAERTEATPLEVPPAAPQATKPGPDPELVSDAFL